MCYNIGIIGLISTRYVYVLKVSAGQLYKICFAVSRSRYWGCTLSSYHVVIQMYVLWSNFQSVIALEVVWGWVVELLSIFRSYGFYANVFLVLPLANCCVLGGFLNIQDRVLVQQICWLLKFLLVQPLVLGSLPRDELLIVKISLQPDQRPDLSFMNSPSIIRCPLSSLGLESMS